MKTRIALLLAAALLALARGATAQKARDAGRDATETRTVAAFERIRLENAAQVRVKVGGAPSVTVTADANILPRVSTEVKDGTLVIGSKDGGYSTRRRVTVEVSAAVLKGVALSGAGAIQVEGATGDEFTAELSGAGRIRVGGEASTLKVRLSGAGSADLKALKARDADIQLSGTGSVEVHATEALAVEVSGVGKVRYFGSPAKRNLHVGGVGAIRQG